MDAERRKFAIYQINLDRDEDGIAFESFQNVMRLTGSETIDARLYDKVAETEVRSFASDRAILQDLYFETQDLPGGSQKIFRGRPISVSDVVEVSNENDEKKFYYCDSFGWQELVAKNAFVAENARDVSAVAPEKFISVLLVRVNEPPRVETIRNNQESLMNVVGGEIGEYFPLDDGAVFVVNENGKDEGKPFNQTIRTRRFPYYFDKNGTETEDIFGDFFVAYSPHLFPKTNYFDENLHSLPRQLIKKYSEMFTRSEKNISIDKQSAEALTRKKIDNLER